MKNLICELDQTIVNPEARDYFLSMPKNNLREAELFPADPKNQTVGIAGSALTFAEPQLVYAKKLVAKYGPNIKISGD